ncbi:MAG: GNAT family N-acetyltransferase [Actinomycetota bacterium]
MTELRLLSGGLASRLGILARPGREQDVAGAIAARLADAKPRPDIFRWEAVDAASQWPVWLSAGWSGGRGHRIRVESERSAPVVHLTQASYDEWLATKSRNFRSQMRRRRRTIEEKGGIFRCADRSTLAADLAEFSRLHSARWEGRGGSGAVNAGTEAMLEEVGEALIDSGRFRLWMIIGPDGRAISAQVFLAAGGVVAYWNGGFDEGWGEHSPGVVAILAAVEDAFARNDDLLDLGGGEARYKERMADEDRPVMWGTSYLGGARYPLARLRRLPEQAARRASHTLRKRLGRDRFNRLRRFFDR